LKLEQRPAKAQTALPFVVPNHRRDSLKQLRASMQELLTLVSKRR